MGDFNWGLVAHYGSAAIWIRVTDRYSYMSLAEENEIESAILEAKVNALSDLQTKANLASTGLNVTEMSSQIMVAATDKLSEITEASDTCNDPLPASLDDYLLLTMGANAASDSTPGSNTGRIIMLAQDLLNSALSTYPGSLQGANRTANAEASLFSVPPPAGYDPVSYTHLRAHETPEHLVCRLLL